MPKKKSNQKFKEFQNFKNKIGQNRYNINNYKTISQKELTQKYNKSRNLIQIFDGDNFDFSQSVSCVYNYSDPKHNNNNYLLKKNFTYNIVRFGSDNGELTCLEKFNRTKLDFHATNYYFKTKKNTMHKKSRIQSLAQLSLPKNSEFSSNYDDKFKATFLTSAPSLQELSLHHSPAFSHAKQINIKLKLQKEVLIDPTSLKMLEETKALNKEAYYQKQKNAFLKELSLGQNSKQINTIKSPVHQKLAQLKKINLNEYFIEDSKTDGRYSSEKSLRSTPKPPQISDNKFRFHSSTPFWTRVNTHC